jgi:hypothetical protein
MHWESKHRWYFKSLWLSLFLVGSGSAYGGNAISAKELIEMPAQSFGQLLQKVGVDSKIAKQSAKPDQESQTFISQYKLPDLIKAAPKRFGDMVLVAHQIHDRQKKQMLAEALPPAEEVAEAGTIKSKPSPVAKKKPAKPVVAQVKVEPAPSVAPPPATLIVSRKDGKVIFAPQSLTFSSPGDSVFVKGAKSIGASVFIRHNDVVGYDVEAGKLESKTAGKTELFLVADNKMYIVPVTVEENGSGKSKFDMQVPDALVSLDGVIQGNMASALFPGVSAATAPEETNVSLDQSIKETESSVAEQEAEIAIEPAKKIAYQAYNLQLVDERTSRDGQQIYPVANATVHVVGTEYRGITNATGHLSIPDLPLDSRFVLQINSGGQIQPATFEIETFNHSSNVNRIRVMRQLRFETLTQIAGTVQDAGLGSVCATIVDREYDFAPVRDVTVQIDVASDGPYHNNRFGYLDVNSGVTGDDGRFCFFNVPSGPVALTFLAEDRVFSVQTMSIGAGRHSEETFTVGAEPLLSTSLVAVGTAHEQLGSNVRLANTYKAIDMIDMIPFGGSDPMAQLGFGELQTAAPIYSHKGRAFAMSQAAEFEPVVYSYSLDHAQHVTPLLPRGYVEDLALYAQVAYDPRLGTLVIEHGALSGQNGGRVNVRVIDQFDRVVEGGWVFQEYPTTKAIFFNLPSGRYSLVIETEDGYWLQKQRAGIYGLTDIKL